MKGGIDLNGVLRSANLVVGLLIIAGGFSLDANPYVDVTSIWLGLALCLQTELSLQLERRRRDPFVILLAFWMILYYELRVFTLSVLPVSAVFDRFEYGPVDSNRALVFILIANAFMVLGFQLARRHGPLAVDVSGWRANAPMRVLLVMFASLALSYLTGSVFADGSVPRGLNFLVLYFSPTVVLLLGLAYALLLRKSLSGWFLVTFFAVMIIEIIAHTLYGSRGAIVNFLQCTLFVLLAIHGSLQLSRRAVTLGILSLPLVAVLLVGAFAVSSYIRATRNTEGVGLSVGVSAAAEKSDKLLDSQASQWVLGAVFARVGYLDFSSEVMANREQYAAVVNFPAYGRSIVDNVLTPGMDVYDQPKIANALLFVYRGMGTPTKNLSADDYQSDQLGIYGEFYVLMGWASLPLFFLIAFLLARLFHGFVYGKTPLTQLMGRVVVLFTFTRLLDSFGIDWLILDVLPLLGALFLYGFFFSVRRRRAGSPAVSHT